MKGKKATIEQLLAINPDDKYFTDYIIDDDGNRIYKTGVVDGALLTAYQIPTAELISEL